MTFEMLAGKPPFSGDTLAAVIHAIVYAPTPPLATLAPATPPAIIAAIERALDKNRDARFPDVGSFVKAVTSRSLATAPGTQQAPRRPEAIAPTERISRERSMMPFFVGIGICVLLAVGALLYKKQLQTAHDEAVAASATPTTTPAPTPKAEPPKADEPKADPPNADEPKPAEPRAAKAVDSGKSQASKAGKEAALSPEAARDLADAEAALDAGKPGEALRLAQHSLYTQKSSRAYAVIARARCAQGDLGNAKAALAQVAARDRSQVVRACGKLGVELH
jgi:serine/threonine-protein kinase